ncbi:MAG: ABC transporter substrate-binding protein [Candidatus Tectomicrobia bacterium]|nr:ABC transporter substrate-binding protein [Candidatus Tectomicrobia bacterium]
MSFAAVFLAQEKKLFEGEGLDVSVRILPGEGGLNALLAGGVDFAQVSSSLLLQESRPGQDLIAVAAPMNRLDVEIVAAREKLEAADLSPSSSLRKRIAFLRGKTIGFQRLGGLAHLYTLYVLAKGGLAPQKDVNLVALGDDMALVTALEQKQIDAFVMAPPISVMPLAQGFGERLISGPENDVEELAPFVSTPLVTLKEYCRTHPDLCRRMVRAYARGNAFIADFPAQALASLTKRYATVKPAILERSLAAYSKTFDRDLRIDPRGLDVVQDLELLTGVRRQRLDVSALFSNAYFE